MTTIIVPECMCVCVGGGGGGGGGGKKINPGSAEKRVKKNLGNQGRIVFPC